MSDISPKKLYALGTISEDRLVHLGSDLGGDSITVDGIEITLGQKNELTIGQFVAFKDHLKRSLLTDELPIRKQLGGVGTNVAEDYLFIAALLGLSAEATLCGRMGMDGNNPHKDFVQPELDKIEGLRVYDSASDDPDFKTPCMHHFIEKSGRRTGVIITDKSPQSDFSAASEPQDFRTIFNEQSPKQINHYRAIGEDAEHHDVAVITSRYPQSSHMLAESAATSGAHLVVDLNNDVTRFIKSPEVTNIINKADDILTPVETFGFENGDALAEHLDMLGKRNFAISDAGKPVIIYEYGLRQADYTPPPLTSDSKDVLGCGDMRTAVVALLRAYGVGFADSVCAATAISSYTANFLGKDWMLDDNARGILQLAEVQNVLKFLRDRDVTEPAPEFA